MAKSPPPSASYEPHKLTELGTVHELTQVTCTKVTGPSDGFVYQGQGMATLSCTA